MMFSIVTMSSINFTVIGIARYQCNRYSLNDSKWSLYHTDHVAAVSIYGLNVYFFKSMRELDVSID
jgi:hypothetical protein